MAIWFYYRSCFANGCVYSVKVRLRGSYAEDRGSILGRLAFYCGTYISQGIS